MYRAGDEREEADALQTLDRAADRLELNGEVRSIARELYLSRGPVEERSKDSLLAASLYAASLIAGQRRAQTEVAQAIDVSRLSIQSRWRELLEDAGFEPPEW
ncbi:MAG: transcription initiation factor IIB family protein [Halodesulfurarchaeum sp.]